MQVKLQGLNNDAKQIWEDIKQTEVQAISDGFETKKRLLTNIKKLSRQDDISSLEILHEINSKKELDGLAIDAWSTK
jgi:uncharacterized protein (UPF0335 family)